MCARGRVFGLKFVWALNINTDAKKKPHTHKHKHEHKHKHTRAKIHAAAGLYAYGDVPSIEEGVKKAYSVLASGAAIKKVGGGPEPRFSCARARVRVGVLCCAVCLVVGWVGLLEGVGGADSNIYVNLTHIRNTKTARRVDRLFPGAQEAGITAQLRYVGSGCVVFVWCVCALVGRRHTWSEEVERVWGVEYVPDDIN